MLHLFFYKNKNIITFLLLITISIISITNDSIKAKSSMENLVLTISSPFITGIYYVTDWISSTWNDITNINKKLEEMKKLRELTLKNKHMYSDNKLLIEEINQLRKQLDLKSYLEKNNVDENDSMPVESAQIIMRNPGIYYNTLIINKGRKHNIKENMPVVAFQIIKKKNLPDSLEKVVVGKISDVTYLYSKIIPLTDPDCVIHAKFINSDYTGFLEGYKGGERGIIFTHLDKMLTITKDEEIITSGGQSIFPKGIKIGIIIKDISTTNSFMKKALVQPYVDFSRLNNIFVIKKEIPEIKFLMDKKK